MINGTLKKLLAVRIQARQAAIVVLLFSQGLLPACINRKQIRAEVWLNSGLPAELCPEGSEIHKYGIYRKLNSGNYQFISYCALGQKDDGSVYPLVQDYITFNAKKFNEVLDGLLPPKK